MSAIRGRSDDPLVFQNVDLHSYGCGKPEPQFTSGQEPGTTPVPWAGTYIRQTGETPVPAENRLEGQLINVSTLTIDAAGACLAAGTHYHIVSDGRTVIRFSDGRALTLASGNNDGVI